MWCENRVFKLLINEVNSLMQLCCYKFIEDTLATYSKSSHVVNNQSIEILLTIFYNIQLFEN